MSKRKNAEVANKYLFFYEAEEDGWAFTIEAQNHEEAFDKAIDEYGPQVEGMYYKLLEDK